MLYKFFSSTTAQETVSRLCQILDENTLWASDPTTFNDPFECKVVLDLNASKEVRHTKYFQDNQKASEAEFECWDAGLSQSKWSVEQETRQQILRTFGLACFTRNWNNELLWSHYARNHTGFCISYDEELIRGWSEVHGALDVAYLQDAPVFKFFEETPDDFVRKVIFSKSKSWAYEEEFRVLFGGSGLRILPSATILEVTLGCRASHELRNEARKRLGKAGYEIFQAAELPAQFRLSRHSIKAKEFVMTSHF